MAACCAPRPSSTWPRSTANVASMKAGTPAELMAVVKADGYGHGLVPSARAALAGGATWLGTAIVDEALALRAAGITAPVLSWLWTPDEAGTVQRALAADVDLSASSEWQLAAVVAAARAVGRAGAGPPQDRHRAVAQRRLRRRLARRWWRRPRRRRRRARSRWSGVWSHFAYADEPGHPTIGKQLDAFGDALEVAARAGVEPQLRHIANSAATLTLPDGALRPRPARASRSTGCRRCAEQYGLTPAMTLRGRGRVGEAGAGRRGRVVRARVHDRRATRRWCWCRSATPTACPGTRATPGRCGSTARGSPSAAGCAWTRSSSTSATCAVAPGDPVVLFGPGRDGEPTAQDWADAAGTIHYEIVTRVGPRVQRVYLGAGRHDAGDAAPVVLPTRRGHPRLRDAAWPACCAGATSSCSAGRSVRARPRSCRASAPGWTCRGGSPRRRS